MNVPERGAVSVKLDGVNEPEEAGAPTPAPCARHSATVRRSFLPDTIAADSRDLVLSPGEAAEFETSLPHWLGSADGGAVELLVLFGLQGVRTHVRGG